MYIRREKARYRCGPEITAQELQTWPRGNDL